MRESCARGTRAGCRARARDPPESAAPTPGGNRPGTRNPRGAARGSGSIPGTPSGSGPSESGASRATREPGRGSAPGRRGPGVSGDPEKRAGGPGRAGCPPSQPQSAQRAPGKGISSRFNWGAPRPHETAGAGSRAPGQENGGQGARRATARESGREQRGARATTGRARAQPGKGRGPREARARANKGAPRRDRARGGATQGAAPRPPLT